MKTEYKTDSDVDSTFKEINAKMSKGSRWFENGDLRLELETDPDNNGSTYMNGRLLLTQDIKDKVMSALGKIGKGESANITREEAQAIGTFWHEITHNRHITTTDRGNAGKKGSTTVKEMELANEWVARHTLDEFYSTLGVKKTPYPEFMTNRDNTGYNSMVTNYDYAIDKLGLDRTKALATVKQYLFNGNYITQAEGLKNGLLDAGIKKADGSTPTAREMTSLLVKIRDLEGKTEWDDTKKCWVKKTKEQLLDEWLQAHGFIKP